MAIPDYQSMMLPLLSFMGDGKEHSLRESIDALADKFALSDEERRHMLPSGQQTTFDNRVGWSRTYMKKAGLLESTRRGYFKITKRGADVLKQNPPDIDVQFLKRFSEFLEFQTAHRNKTETGNGQDVTDEPQTPEEEIEAAYQKVRQGLATELLQTIKTLSPTFFERLVIDLLVKMGYGGTRTDAGEAIGRSGAVLTALLRKIGLVSMLFTYKPNVGKGLSVDLIFRSLQVLCKGNAREKVSSSPPRTSPKRPMNTFRASTARSY